MPDQEALPGMQDRKIEALQDAALSYAKIRDKRQKLTLQEVELKTDLLKLMKKHRRDHYEYDGIEINVVTEEETVKVRIRKPEKEDDV